MIVPCTLNKTIIGIVNNVFPLGKYFEKKKVKVFKIASKILYAEIIKKNIQYYYSYFTTLDVGTLI